MIFVASGTQDGRGLVEYLLKQNYKVMASVVTNYGKELLPKDENLIINDHKLDEEAMKNCLKENQIKVFVDATHPYAVNVSKTAMQVCDELNIPYIRYEREVTPIPAYNKLHLVKTYEEASDLAMQLGENIFLTTGSNRLDLFANDSKKYNKHIIARVLPAIASLQICENCGVRRPAVHLHHGHCLLHPGRQPDGRRRHLPSYRQLCKLPHRQHPRRHERGSGHRLCLLRCSVRFRSRNRRRYRLHAVR